MTRPPAGSAPVPVAARSGAAPPPVASLPAAPGPGPLPVGLRLQLDPRTRFLHGGRVLLTASGRLLRLRDPSVLAELVEGRASSVAVRRLGERLIDAGAAHPVPQPRDADDVTVVVPVRDRAVELDRCLASLVGDVLVVDDGSVDPASVEAVCRRHGARYVLRPVNGGPAAARNTALPLLDKEFVAFLDSDCVPPQGWLRQLRGHLDDPRVGAVAPRVVGGHRSPLDLGPRPAAVRPGTQVSYVPTAALLVRRSALDRFDEALRYGEDVDLVWRLHDAGWAIRYDPRVVVDHQEPARLSDRLVRQVRYGTAAAPLSRRHPDRLAHLMLPPWPTAALALLLARRPRLAAAVLATSAVRLDRHLDDASTSARVVLSSASGTGLGLGRALALTGPLGWWLASRDRRAAALLLAPPLVEWAQRRPSVDPLRYTATALLDQAAYGAGVLLGCWRHRTVVPLLPRRR